MSREAIHAEELALQAEQIAALRERLEKSLKVEDTRAEADGRTAVA